MNNMQLVPITQQLPAVFKKDSLGLSTPVLTYSRIDDLHYSFECDFNDTITFRMDESNKESQHTDFVEAEFSDRVTESNRKYYALAAASGTITGALCFLKLSEEKLERIQAWKNEEWKKYVQYAAELAGCKKSDYKSSAKHLVKLAAQKINQAENAGEYLAQLNTHPTMAGLIFAFITQYAKQACFINDQGEIILNDLPKYYYVGQTHSEKIVAAVLYWLFALGVGQANSARRILDDLNIPAALLNTIKAFSRSKIFANVPKNYKEAEKEYSEWMKDILSKAQLTDIDGDGSRPLVLQLMRSALNLGDDAFPVLINECIVRSLYILLCVVDALQTCQVQSLENLKNFPANELLPHDGRLLSGMCVAASASFVCVNLTVAALKAVSAAKANERGFCKEFISEVNIVGIGRFIFACAADSKYWGDDIKPFFQRKSKPNKKQTAQSANTGKEAAFAALTLDANQIRLLYCFENLSVRQDILRTDKADDKASKNAWLSKWRSNILLGLGIPSESESAFFIENEDYLYDGIYALSKDKANHTWFYLLTQELALFEPYYSLGTENDSKFKKLKCQYNYVSDQFIRRQTIVSQEEVTALLKTYKKYTDYVTGKTAKTITMVAGGTAITVLSGGLALAYAPGIAAMIAGEAVVGLHGAALTGASLAFVGGGSLAAGGLGVAGGTAIITGGGALIGLAGSGGASAVAVMMSAPNDYWIRQSAKLLTFAKCILCDILGNKAAVQGLSVQVSHTIDETSAEIAALKEENTSLDAEYLRRLSRYASSLEKVHSELEKICQ